MYGWAIVSPILGGMLLDNTPGPTLWILLAVLAGAVAAGQIITGPARERRAGRRVGVEDVGHGSYATPVTGPGRDRGPGC